MVPWEFVRDTKYLRKTQVKGRALELKSHYATIVVGAGPAGVMTSVYASALGDVLLVDAMSMPREKSCGGMLNEYAQAFLKSVGEIPADVISDPEWINFRFYDWDRKIKKATSLRFMNVDRVKFDDWMMSMLPGNVTVLSKTRFTGLKQDDEKVTATFRSAESPNGPEFTVEADYLVGCDGPRSSVRRSLPVTQLKLYKTLQEFLPADGELEPYFDCLYSRNIGENYGYGYLIPKDGMAIIGSVFFPGSKNCLEAHEAAIAEYRTRYHYGYEQLRPREAWTAVKVNKVSDVVGGIGRVLLAGEANGIMSPSSGEGISFAMNSGKLAGLAIATQGKHRNAADSVLENYKTSLKPIKNCINRKLKYFPIINSRFGKWMGGNSPAFLVDAVAHRI